MKYLDKTYIELIKKSYTYDVWEQFSSAWSIVHSLYKHNYCESFEEVSNIPKIIHQIWLGGQVPEKYIKYIKSWRKFNPDWEYKLWQDKDIDSINLTKREIFAQAVNNGMRSDILRYEILHQQGGIYIDIDFECLKPFDDLLYLDFFTGISYDKQLCLYNGLIASIPNHPIINRCVNTLKDIYKGNKASIIMDITGPYYFTRCFLSELKNITKGIVAFPMDFFYPLPNNVRETSTPYEYVQPCSYAIHHWDVSWIKKKVK
jgi:inositol phosphorylceramide mannosyltransferase catalytic subunit